MPKSYDLPMSTQLAQGRGRRLRRTVVIGATALLTASSAASSTAEACSPNPPTPITGVMPFAGTTNVSTMTTIVLSSTQEPSGLALFAADAPVGPLSFERLGSGVHREVGQTSFWRVQIGASPDPGEPLQGNTEYLLTSAGGSDGGQREVTRFTTSSGYDKDGGAPPVLHGMKLWRVRYPVKDIASGNCVFAEYHGFVTVDYLPAVTTNTPAGAMIHTFSLAPKTGGAPQTFVYVGKTAFMGLEPTGAYPAPVGEWRPELDPTLDYCLTISAFGDGDRARPPLNSKSVCAPVIQRSAAGAPPPPGVSQGGGGCALAGAAPVRAAAIPWACTAMVAIGALAVSRRRRSR